MGKNANANNPDYVIAIIVIALVLFGIIMVFSATYYSEQASGETGQGSFLSQVIGVIIGITAMYILSHVDYHLFLNGVLLLILLALSFAFLVALYFLPKINNAHRWIDFGLFMFQPAEVARFSIILLTAKVLSDKDNLQIARSWRLKELFNGLIFYFSVLLAVTLLILFEPSLTLPLMILGAVLCMFIAVGIKWRLLFALGGITGIVAAAAIYFTGYRKERLLVFINPWIDSAGSGYQLLQSLYALGSGGLFGVGLGNSKQKLLYLTYGDSDFILSIIGEELGFFGVSLLLIAFIVLIVRCFVTAINSKDLAGTVLAVGIASSIAIQTVLNVGVATCSIPATGVPLPFISSGNTSLIIFMAEIGILLNISKQSKAKT